MELIEPAATIETDFTHQFLPCGVELAVDHLPARKTVAIYLRVLGGVVVDPPDLTGITSIVESTLAKGTANYTGRQLADAFDALGAQWSTTTGRQSILVRCVCLPEFALEALDLLAEMIRRPTFPDDACEVAVRLAQEELRHMEDDPGELLRADLHRLVYGPVLGRDPNGETHTLPNITPDKVRRHWRETFHTGAIQIAVAGPVHAAALAERAEAALRGLGASDPRQREPADFSFTPGRRHRPKDLKQQYLALSLPGLPRSDGDFAVEQVLMGVLSGGMSGRLFTEVREKQGLVYWVGAWHEQPRGKGVINLGASTTPERCERTYQTLLRELERLREDLSEEEVTRARNSLLAHAQTEDDLTRARAAGLSDDLFHFSRPVGPAAKMAAVRAVSLDRVRDYVRRMNRDQVCVTTVGPREL